MKMKMKMTEAYVCQEDVSATVAIVSAAAMMWRTGEMMAMDVVDS